MSDGALAGLLVIAPLFAITITKASNVRQRSLLVDYYPHIGPDSSPLWTVGSIMLAPKSEGADPAGCSSRKRERAC